MKVSKYLAVIVLASGLTAQTTLAADEYLRNTGKSGGKTAAIASGAKSLIQSAAEVIIMVSKDVYEVLKNQDTTHTVEVGYTDNSEVEGSGDSRFVRYKFNFDGISLMQDEDVSLGFFPVRVTFQADDQEDGITVEEVEYALVKLKTDFGIEVTGMGIEQGNSEKFGTSIFNENYEKQTWFTVDYSDTLWTSGDGVHQLVLNGYWDFKMGGESVTDLETGESFEYYDGHELGGSIALATHSSMLGGLIIPEAFYRTSWSDSHRDDDTGIRNEGFSGNRYGLQLVLQKSIMKTECRFTAGFAIENFSGDVNTENDEVYVKGKCGW
jgi:hypothetical protein